MLFKKKEYTNNSIEFIIVGLGNPGKQYEGTRHNAGFIAIDYIAEELGAKINKIKFKSTIGEATISGKRCLLMKPEAVHLHESQRSGSHRGDEFLQDPAPTCCYTVR